jgi:hypothetical protein
MDLCWLGVDLVCLALPGATGGRLAVTAVEEGVNHALTFRRY